MVLIKKIVGTYHYIYFRLLIFHIKQWDGINGFGRSNANYAISASAVALLGSLDLVYSRISGSLGFINGVPSMLLMVFIVVIIQSLILPDDDAQLIEKYSPQKENDPYWRIKGILSLTFIFGPFILLILLMHYNI